jgi:hypothetical protein
VHKLGVILSMITQQGNSKRLLDCISHSRNSARNDKKTEPAMTRGYSLTIMLACDESALIATVQQTLSPLFCAMNPICIRRF